jgi:hypothetical protein
MAATHMLEFVFDRALPLHIIQPVIHPNINTIRPGRNPIRHTHFIHEQTKNPQKMIKRDVPAPC